MHMCFTVTSHECHGVSYGWQPHCLISNLYTNKDIKAPHLIVGLLRRNPPAVAAFPWQMTNDAERVSMSWRHKVHAIYTGHLVHDMWYRVYFVFRKSDLFMMTSSNGNIFRITGHLCGEFTGHRWIPLTKASDAGLWCFLWSAPE